jgi:hypothetical protein
MIQMNIFLLGKHSNRTPMAYEAYRLLFESRGVRFVTSIKQADLIVLGFSIDIQIEVENLKAAVEINPNVLIIVISEEPLWDSIWTKDFKSQRLSISAGGRDVNYYQLNHFNSDIYNFQYFPYFLTTEDKYLIRYSNFFSRNSQISRPELIKKFNSKIFLFASIAEKRVDDEVNRYDDNRILGLSKLRTIVAENVSSKKLCIGKGWANRPPRQQEFDWHLSKLSEFDDATLIMSSIENTVNSNYITEKIFDAYATLSFPLYYADKNHGIHKIIKNNSPIYFSTDNLQYIVNSVELFSSNWQTKIDAYMEDMNGLHKLFSNFEKYKFEREAIVDRILSNIYKITS